MEALLVLLQTEEFAWPPTPDRPNNPRARAILWSGEEKARCPPFSQILQLLPHRSSTKEVRRRRGRVGERGGEGKGEGGGAGVAHRLAASASAACCFMARASVVRSICCCVSIASRRRCSASCGTGQEGRVPRGEGPRKGDDGAR